jgi:drug/metabolite transporter (DMT)-like permease
MTTHTPAHAHIRQTRPIGVAYRIVFTGLGAAGLIVGAFLKWTRDLKGTELSWRAVYEDSFGVAEDTVHSVGGPAIVLGLLAVLGLAERSGWLTRLAGALGIIGMVLVIIEIERSPDHGLQWGVWTALAGSVLCIAAGMASVRETVRETTIREPVSEPVEPAERVDVDDEDR